MAGLRWRRPRFDWRNGLESGCGRRPRHALEAHGKRRQFPAAVSGLFCSWTRSRRKEVLTESPTVLAGRSQGRFIMCIDRAKHARVVRLLTEADTDAEKGDVAN